MSHIVSSEMFTITDGILTCDDSTLRAGRPGSRNVIIDEISIRSKRTGVVCKFVIDRNATKRDREGDVLYWVYKPANSVLRDRGVAVHLFND